MAYRLYWCRFQLSMRSGKYFGALFRINLSVFRQYYLFTRDVCKIQKFVWSKIQSKYDYVKKNRNVKKARCNLCMYKGYKNINNF